MAFETLKQALTDRESRRRLIDQSLEIADRLPPILAMLPGKGPKFVAVGLRGAKVGYSLYDKFVVGDENPYSYMNFGPNTGIHRVARTFQKLCMQIATDMVVLGRGERTHALAGKIGDVGIKWIRSKEGTECYHMVCRASDYPQLYTNLRDYFWQDINTQHVILNHMSVEEAPVATGDIVQTGFLTTFTERVRLFLEAGQSRSYLLVGPPGVGKSRAARQIAHSLGLKTATIPLSIASSADMDRGVDHLVRQGLMAIAPDVVILDDLDRVSPDLQGRLLDVLEQSRSATGVVVVTANHEENLSTALRRPGRLDDRVHVSGLTAEEVRVVLGRGSADLTALPGGLDMFSLRLSDWPIAFVLDLRTRLETLGCARAMEELADLEYRVRLNRVADAPSAAGLVDDDADEMPEMGVSG